MVDRTNRSVEEQVERRVERGLWIENGGQRNHQTMAVGLFCVCLRLGDAGIRCEVGSRQGRRDGQHPDSAVWRLDRTSLAWRLVVAIRRHVGGRIELHPDCHQHRLGGIDHRATTDCHQQIGTGLTGSQRTIDDILARTVGPNLRPGAAMPIAECPADTLQWPVIKLAEGAPGGQEYPPRTHSLDLFQNRLRGRATEDHLLLGLHEKCASGQLGVLGAHDQSLASAITPRVASSAICAAS